MRVIKDRAKRKVSTIDSIFVGSGIPTPLPPEDSNLTGVPKAAQKIKEQNRGSIKKPGTQKLPQLGYIVQKLKKMWVKIGLNWLSEILGKWGPECLLKG